MLCFTSEHAGSIRSVPARTALWVRCLSGKLQPHRHFAIPGEISTPFVLFCTGGHK